MLSPVHISVEHKVHVTVLLHSHDLEIMHGVIISVICIPAFPEAEDLGHLIGADIV